MRALEVLAAADLIACEDTRVTRKLLDHYGITTPLTPYHDHNAAEARPRLLARLADGAAIALVSDAGTPLVSDPGYKLVRAAREQGAGVTAVPGASAVLAALTVSGLPTDRFFFEGFLPAKEHARRARIGELKHIPATLVLFETGAGSPPRWPILPPGSGRGRRRSAASSPSSTRRCGAAISRRSRANLRQAPNRRARSRSWWRRLSRRRRWQADDLDALLRQALDRLSVKDAVAEIAAATGQPRREVYRRALALIEDRSHDR